MTSTRERQQRAAARAKLARQMAERQATAKKRRQRLIGIGGAVALAVVVLGTVGIVIALNSEAADPTVSAGETPDPVPPFDPDVCAWVPEDPSSPGYEMLTEVGTPAPDEPREGVSTITMETNHGAIEIEMDHALVPCAAASFTHLAEVEFYDGASCHRLVTEGIYVLQCGDPTGTGQGGPTYRYPEENLPVGQSPPYARGQVAMAKTQAPSSTGSQFFIVYDDDASLTPDYTLLGTVTEGLEIVEQIAAAGHDGAYEPAPGGGRPNEEVVIETLRVAGPA